jgi:formylglycine-generating enzyme required for sulfatase activity
MAGNVSEWTVDSYETVRTFVADINPVNNKNVNSNEPMVLQRKVIRGGSWKDIGYYLQNGTRTYEYQDNAKPYIGFRYVRSASNEFKLDI